MFGRRSSRSSRAGRRATFGILAALAPVVVVGASATLTPRMIQLAADVGDGDRGAGETAREQAATGERPAGEEGGSGTVDAKDSSEKIGEEGADEREDAGSEASESGKADQDGDADQARGDDSTKEAPDQEAKNSAEFFAKKDRERAERARAEQTESGPPPPSDPTMSLSVPRLGLQGDTVRNSAAPAAMDQGAIKLPSTGFPWQEGANTYIAGHRIGYPGTESRYQFYDLPAMQNGDAVYLTDANGTTYEYRVSEKFAVAPTDTSVTEPQAGRDMVTLQTCVDSIDPSTWWDITPKLMEAGPDSGRLVVQADKVATYPA